MHYTSYLYEKFINIIGLITALLGDFYRKNLKKLKNKHKIKMRKSSHTDSSIAGSPVMLTTFMYYCFLAGVIMSLYSYKVFQTVVKEKSFSKAAKALNLTPSAVSHNIAKFEEEIGFPVFEHMKRSAELNDAGLQIYPYIEDILNTNELLEKRISQINDASVGTVRLGLVDSVAVNWLPDIMKHFREQYPRVEVELKESTYNELVEDVTERQLDLAFVSYAAIRANKVPLQFIPLYQDRMVCVTPGGYVPENGDYITFDELKKLSFFFPTGVNSADVMSILDENEYQYTPRHASITNSSLVAMVRGGCGVGVAAWLSVKCASNLEGLNVYPIFPFKYRTLGLITREPRYLMSAATAMIGVIKEYVSGLTRE